MKLNQRTLLQVTIALCGLVPVLAGGAGMFFGKDLLGADNGGLSLDSHFRYLSGLLFGIGIAFWNMIPWIERATKYVRLLTLIVMIGGIARLYGAIFVGWPPLPMQLALVMELIVTPLLCLWQRTVARKYGSS